MQLHSLPIFSPPTLTESEIAASNLVLLLTDAGILIVVAIGVALGVLIGGILLSVVAYYMRRYLIPRLHDEANIEQTSSKCI